MSPTVIDLINAHHAIWGAAIPALARLDTSGRPLGCLKFWPRTFTPPQMITLLGIYTPDRLGSSLRNRLWRFEHQYVVNYQDNEQAEIDMLTNIETLEAAIHGIDGDIASITSGMHLGNLAGFQRGTAKFVSATPDFLTVNGQPLYRVVTIVTEVTIK